MIVWLLLLLTKERRAYRKYSSLSLGNLVMKVLQLALQMMSEGFWHGKTTIHDIQCPFLGQKGSFHCNCPKRLASNTVEGIINQLVNIFDDIGLGRDWNIVSESGNPASAQAVKEYLKLIRVEQAKSHVLPKQAKPIFLTKVKAISSFIDREIKIVSLSLREKFTLYRDQAWWKIQFFADDRAGDLALVVAQEVKILTDGSGLVFQHRFGKTLRGSKGKSNSFVIKRCNDIDICPVKGLIDYVNFCRSCKVDLTRGYLFRVVSEIGSVLDKPVSYSVVYQRLIYYLTTLGMMVKLLTVFVQDALLPWHSPILLKMLRV
jgi:hypothetical protein